MKQTVSEYFDSIADRWDGWMDMDRIDMRLIEGLRRFGLKNDETVLDVGCGTGNLTAVLLSLLSPMGKVAAVDLSPRMIARARLKNPDPRAEFHLTGAGSLPFPDETFNRVICYSVWPHVTEPQKAIGEIRRVLKPGGVLHIWHIDSRETINRIHAGAGETVRSHMLAPAADVAAMLAKAGFAIGPVVDCDTEYLITASKP